MLFFDNFYGHSHVLHRTVVGTAFHCGDFVDNVKSFNHFAENGVVVVEPGRAAYGAVG